MNDQYFGTKELYQVSLKANYPMKFGNRSIEAGEPILYFENINIAILTEQSRPIIARGGWANMPRVIWEDRSEITFSLSEGVMSNVGMGILLSANVFDETKYDKIYLNKKEIFELDKDNSFILQETPTADKPAFCYEYDRKTIQRKVDKILEDKKIIIPDGDQTKNYLLDYYFIYGEEALIYLIEKERFTGDFSLEGKFYTKDENDGLNTTNVLFMPKVRVVSNINLRLGEKADPTVSVFNIIAMPKKTDNGKNVLMEIIHLNKDIDGDI